MKAVNFDTFHRSLDLEFKDQQNSVCYQLFELTDLFQKISAIYKFAALHEDTSFQNPIIFQIVESALTYGVCVQIRRLANGRQPNEISLFKITNALKSQCRNWTRLDFVTWDGSPYDSAKIRQAHQEVERELTSQMIAGGERSGYLPIGKHEEIERRHQIFDILCNKRDNVPRRPDDKWKPDLPNYLLNILQKDTDEIVAFVNRYLAHRIQPTKQAQFNISLEKVRTCITALWKCVNVINSIFYDSYTTPDIIHSIGSFDSLELPLVPLSRINELVQFYETVKGALERETNTHASDWPSEFHIFRTSSAP